MKAVVPHQQIVAQLNKIEMMRNDVQRSLDEFNSSSHQSFRHTTVGYLQFFEEKLKDLVIEQTLKFEKAIQTLIDYLSLDSDKILYETI